eukprot:TRINITY_DN4736_c0_g1_i2.p1 TRINITY_DN4736_c0_g1~~TRINITY_DN4736_c0_g1_i2.p1  ORF type:complete len:157 (+),score=26.31 TRINITY_DN4736_c0_g1_i2:15-485(+)
MLYSYFAFFMLFQFLSFFDSQRLYLFFFFFFQAEDGIRDHAQSRGLGDVYKRQVVSTQSTWDTITKVLAMLAENEPLKLDALNRPSAFFASLVHQGCTRNEYHEYDIEDDVLGGRACMFFSLGCRGPQTEAPCNTELWNGHSSKTRAGVPLSLIHI